MRSHPAFRFFFLPFVSVKPLITDGEGRLVFMPSANTSGEAVVTT